VKRYIAIVFVLLVTGCAATKSVARTLNDVARNLCMLTASDYGEEKLGMTPKDWCDVRENLDPFIREVTSAQAAAVSQSGLAQPKASQDGGT
jgi:hypothetical protein